MAISDSWQPAGSPWHDDLRIVLGGKTVTSLKSGYDIGTVGDLLSVYPRRYFERGELTELSKLRIDDDVTVVAEVVSVRSNSSRGRRAPVRTEVVVTDGTDRIALTFFNQRWRERELQPGVRGLFAGKVGSFRGRRQLVHPAYQIFGSDEPDQALRDFVDVPIPIYPGRGGVKSWTFQKCVALVLDHVGELEDPLPADLRSELGLMSFDQALRTLHQPRDLSDTPAARARMKFQEALLLQLVLLRRRAAARAQPAVPRGPGASDLPAKLDRQLPFELTTGQRAVCDEILTDLAQDVPMLRLLQGDVGSGKTVVALRAMASVVAAGGQTALLAPTEVLAAQHYETLANLLGPLGRRGQIDGDEDGTQIVLVTGSMSTAARRRALAAIVSGDAGIVVGTHALLSEDVMFADLALVVVDEQHRFGVDQRSLLGSKAGGGRVAHTLVMTATPIPRTVAMTVFGDLDVSTLTERPAFRQPVATHVVHAQQRPAFAQRAWERIREEVQAGRQAFVVCPRIVPDGEEETTVQGYCSPAAAEQVADWLREGPLADVRVGLLHGQMSSDDKARTMAQFAGRDQQPPEIDVLVSTTVIEVGVDVSNATVMVILDADRFGLSALHQLRGRIGRGEHSGLCLLMTQVAPDDPAGERLESLATTPDGFDVSLLDLQVRREGDVLGAAQSGRATTLDFLNVVADQKVVARARAVAQRLLADDGLASQPALARTVEELADLEAAGYLDRG